MERGGSRSGSIGTLRESPSADDVGSEVSVEITPDRVNVTDVVAPVLSVFDQERRPLHDVGVRLAGLGAAIPGRTTV